MKVPEWETASGRSKDRARVNAAVSEVTRTKPAQWWIETLEEAGIPCGPVNDIREVFDDPQVQHLGIRWPMKHPDLGDIALVGQPMRLSRHPRTEPAKPAPRQGDDTDAILSELGYSDQRIAELRAAVVV